MGTRATLALKPSVVAAVTGLLAVSLTLIPGQVSEPSAHSRVATASFYSQAMNMPRSYEIYLPPSYGLALDRRYPVLYLLHGDGGRIDDWPALGLRWKLDQAITKGGPEMIAVMPDGSGHYGDLTDWANRWDGTDRVEDQVLELVGVVDHSYRTVRDRSTRFIGGLSSGGFGALNIALHHPDLLSTIGRPMQESLARTPATSAGTARVRSSVRRPELVISTTC